MLWKEVALLNQWISKLSSWTTVSTLDILQLKLLAREAKILPFKLAPILPSTSIANALNIAYWSTSSSVTTIGTSSELLGPGRGQPLWRFCTNCTSTQGTALLSRSRCLGHQYWISLILMAQSLSLWSSHWAGVPKGAKNGSKALSSGKPRDNNEDKIRWRTNIPQFPFTSMCYNPLVCQITVT